VPPRRWHKRAGPAVSDTSENALGTFPERLSARAARALSQLGVTPILGRTVVDIGGDAVTLAAADGRPERVPARTVVWAAGVRASGLAAALARACGARLDRAGRVTVGPGLTLPGHPEVFALGDMVCVNDGDGRPLGLLLWGPLLAAVTCAYHRRRCRDVSAS